MISIPYSRQNITEEDIAAVSSALRADFVTQGPAIPDFEMAFAKCHATAHCVAVNNATAGLHVACLALDVGPGSRVWTSPNSFLSSANCALFCGAQIDFVDIDPVTRNMSVGLLEEKLLRAKQAGKLPNVVIPVDFSGLPCDMRSMRALADKFRFKLLEDASHATGAIYLGAPVGSVYAHATVFSFHAVKVVTTAEGGMVATQDEKLAAKMRLLRSHGMTRDPAELERQGEGGWYYEQKLLGFNYRMTDLQAALGLSQLKRLDHMHAQRESLASRYDSLLSDLPLILPPRLPDSRSAWHLYVVEVDSEKTSIPRIDVYNRLRAAGIGANVHYIPIHTQPFYRRLGFKAGDFPASERYYNSAISIPLFPELTHEQQDQVIACLKGVLV
jgi:UDP-4-amino-4,6-dideoxy-N-acetyl-beta-L-altrosamine transaminase